MLIVSLIVKQFKDVLRSVVVKWVADGFDRT